VLFGTLSTGGVVHVSVSEDGELLIETEVEEA